MISSVLAASVARLTPRWRVWRTRSRAASSSSGAGLGIALIGSKAVDSIARQPEAGSRIFISMILAAALIEGVTFFALLICFLAVFWLK